MKPIKERLIMILGVLLLSSAFFSGVAVAENCEKKLTADEFEELYGGD